MPKTCFIISSIGEEDSEIRDLADTKYDLVFEPVLVECGYKSTRADKIGSPGSISYDIVKHLIASDLVLADVSDLNPNVFYELAVRNAVKKPYILIKGIEQKLPFDIQDIRAVSLDMTDARQWTDTKEKLKIQVNLASEIQNSASKSILTDFSFQIDVNQVNESKTDVDLLLKDIRNEVRSLREEIQRRPSPIFRSQRLPYSKMNSIQKERTARFIEIMKELRLENRLPISETNLFIELKTKAKLSRGLSNTYVQRMIAAGVIDEVQPGHYSLLRDEYPDF